MRKRKWGEGIIKRKKQTGKVKFVMVLIVLAVFATPAMFGTASSARVDGGALLGWIHLKEITPTAASLLRQMSPIYLKRQARSPFTHTHTHLIAHLLKATLIELNQHRFELVTCSVRGSS